MSDAPEPLILFSAYNFENPLALLQSSLEAYSQRIRSARHVIGGAHTVRDLLPVFGDRVDDAEEVLVEEFGDDSLDGPIDSDIRDLLDGWDDRRGDQWIFPTVVRPPYGECLRDLMSLAPLWDDDGFLGSIATWGDNMGDWDEGASIMNPDGLIAVATRIGIEVIDRRDEVLAGSIWDSDSDAS